MVAGWLVLAGCAANVGWASGPRFVTGPPFFTGPAALAIGWRQTNLMYFTDAGDLSGSVNHAAADAMVAAAAAVWTVPVAKITLGQGGGLAEDVSGQNVYLDSTGMVWPRDVMAGNAAAVPIAVIYDADGAVTDTLLGAGASDPAGCRQNSVTESVDGFDPAGYILHAVIILNGRCTEAAPELQLEMRYKLERAFGRVLGLAWSQTNDNVFTGVPQPTYNQALNWPVMHPVDLICGPYSFQCTPNPFQLRPDDVASLVALYPIAQGSTPPAGKQQSLARAAQSVGQVIFPTGEGMAGVNVVVRREAYNTFTPESWYTTSGLTGTRFRRAGLSPFAASDGSAAGSMGSGDPGWLGRFSIAYTPVPDGDPWQGMIFATEAVNPLYTGEYSLGPYGPGTVTPSGSPPVAQIVDQDAAFGSTETNFVATDAAQACGDGTDGTAGAPTATPATGWWRGVLCGYGHASYRTLAVQPGRTLTVEVTALNELGLATVTKAMPVMGVFGPGDGAGGLPSVAVTPTAFNARGLGTTTLEVTTGSLTGLRLGIADQRGDGRPDYAYQARVFYADSVVPANVDAGGATVTVFGMGFRAGNAVRVNGVPATVTSWTANALVMTVPALTKATAVGAGAGTAVDVVVTDLSTGATSTMSQALTYGGAQQGLTMRLASAPEATGSIGTALTTAFAVQVLSGGGTAVAGERVMFSAVSGGASFAGCATATCSVVTDAQGLASVLVTPGTQGNVVLRATDATNASLSQTVSFMVQSGVGSIAVISAPTGAQTATVISAAAFTVRVLAADGVTGLGGRAVVFSVTAGAATFGGCFSTPCTVTTDGSGLASVTVTPGAEGAITLMAASGGAARTVNFTGASDRDVMQLTAAPLAKVFVGENAGKFGIRLLRVDGVTGDSTQAVVYTVPDGLVIAESGTTQMTQNTDGQGYSQVTLLAKQAGTFVATVSFGSVSQSATVVVAEHSLSLQILSTPRDGTVVGTASTVPFTVRLMRDGTDAVPNTGLALGGSQGNVRTSGCGLGSCVVSTDGNGVASVTVTPLRAGTIALSASYVGLVQSTSFQAAGPAETIRVVTQPGAAGVLAGDAVTLGVQLIGTDGTTAFAGKTVTYSVLNGPFAFTDCPYGACNGSSDDGGFSSVHGLAYGTGAVTVQAVEGELVQTISFVAHSKPEVLRLVSGPASGSYVGVAAATPFAVQVLFADGVTAAPGKSVTLSVTSGQASLSACAGSPSCVVQSDAGGMVRTQVSAGAAGVIGLQASEGVGSVSESFSGMLAPEMLQVVSAPQDGSQVGTAAAVPFAVKVVTAETPGRAVAGRSVTFTVTDGAASLSCGGSSCVVTTDANGTAAVGVTATAAGTVRLLAAEGGLTQAAAYSAAARADVLQLVSSAGPAVFAGETATTAFAVRLVRADGVTPVAGMGVVFAGIGVQFGCGASSCTVVTDGSGLARTLVLGTTAGTAMLSATAEGGALVVGAALEVRADVYDVTVQPQMRWVAAGAVLRSVLRGVAMKNGSAAGGQTLVWQGMTGVQVGAAESAAGVDGAGLMPVVIGPLAGGTTGTATVCGWGSACASFTATGVAAEGQQVQLTGGAGQSVGGSDAYGAVTVTVTDAAGHAVGGAAVTVYQGVLPAAVACPGVGVCAAEATLLAQTMVLTSGEDGTVSVVPISVVQGATRTEMVFTCGTQATISTVLNRLQ